MKLSFDDKESFMEAVESLRFDNRSNEPNTLQRMGSSSSIPPQERSEDICFNNPPSDTNELRRMGSSSGSSSMPLKVWDEDRILVIGSI